MRFQTKKKCMKGGVISIKRRSSMQKVQTNNTSTEANNTNIDKHPDIGRPIPKLSILKKLRLSKEYKPENYGIDDLTPEEKLREFDKLRAKKPHISSESLLPEFYRFLKTKYEDISYEKRMKKKKQTVKKMTEEQRQTLREKLKKGIITLTNTSTIYNAANNSSTTNDLNTPNTPNYPVQESISPEILKEIKRNSNNYARRRMMNKNKYNMNSVNNTKRNKNLNNETIALREKRMKQLLNIRKEPIINKKETETESEKQIRIENLGYQIKKKNSGTFYEIPRSNESSTNNNEPIYEILNTNDSSTNNENVNSTPPDTEPREIYFRRPPRPSNSILRQHGFIKNKEESFTGGFVNKKSKKSKKNSKNLKI